MIWLNFINDSYNQLYSFYNKVTRKPKLKIDGKPNCFVKISYGLYTQRIFLTKSSLI
jgi:hypothetical protein